VPTGKTVSRPHSNTIPPEKPPLPRRWAAVFSAVQSRREFFNAPLDRVDPVNIHIGLFAAVDADQPHTRLFPGSYSHPVVAAAQWDNWQDVAAKADAD
jgi:hypothetical protein